MATKLLSVANSAAHRHRGPTSTVERALAVLGTDTVRTLVIGQSVFQAFYGLPALRHVDLRPYWQHALLAAAAGRELARLLDYPREDEAYLAGLLHDIGRLGLLAAAPDDYAEAFGAADDRALCDQERQALRVSHAEAGAWLLERWRLDAAIADSVRYHHEPLPRIAALHPLLRIVALAHLVAEQVPQSVDELGEELRDAGRHAGLSEAQLRAVAVLAQGKLVAAAEQLGVELPARSDAAAQRLGRLSADAAAERLRVELSPMMVAATVLNDLPLAGAEPALLQRLADAARIVFQFTEVVVMLPDAAGRSLRWVGAAPQAAADGVAFGALPRQWAEFSLPAPAGTRIGDALLRRQPAFVGRESRAGAPPDIAEDQLLRLLSTDQLVCLPLGGEPRGNAQPEGGLERRLPPVLVCVGDAALMAHLRLRRELLLAFMLQAQALRARAQRLQAVGERERAELVARHALGLRDLAHEVNNPLSIIQNYLSLLDVKLAADSGRADAEALAQDIAVLQQEVARVGRLVQALTAPALPTPGSVDVNALLADVVRLFAQTGGVDLRDHPHPGQAEVLADRDALQQILVNLVKNAVEALASVPPGGAVEPGRIAVANNGLVNRDGRLMIEISVRDNGPGMPPELLAGLFNEEGAAAPSSKPGNDRGRGLAIVHRLVTRLGGVVQCRSSVAGTSVDVFLPHRAGHDPLTPAR